MINPRAIDRSKALAEDRLRLVAQIALQRETLQVQWAPLARAAGSGDRALAVLGRARQYVKAYRTTLTLGLAVTGMVLVLAKPGRFMQLLKSGVVLWRGWRIVQSAQAAGSGSWLGRALPLVRRWFPNARV